ncbi:universal stress protein [Roseofilum casamattae]|uniref:Universal stress protein n=1 Tax=Roseofilum casamattae BLCC-M143 TaxID=3022442 RepID=A0ABT7BWA7_9CYAN|nr:universal stress protein [Roseofilum casamattae]MDJ1183480.1 universal stress protein [Roseofilum casamattae BLCC-M143]
MFKRALISTDLSDGLYRLVNALPALGESGLEHIVFTHCVALEGKIPKASEEKIEWARSRLSTLRPDIPERLDVTGEVVPSSRPHEAILQIADKHQSDLIVFGANTHTLMAEKLFGSTSMNVAQHTELPIMVLRPQLISTYTSEELNLRCRNLFRYLMLPYDDSNSGKYLLERVTAYAKERPENSLEKILLVWVIDEGSRRDFSGIGLDQARAKLETVKKELEGLDLEVEVEVRKGEVIPQIFESALIHDISAIAVSSGRRNLFAEFSAPSISNKILRRSWHPIIYFSPRH